MAFSNTVAEAFRRRYGSLPPELGTTFQAPITGTDTTGASAAMSNSLSNLAGSTDPSDESKKKKEAADAKKAEVEEVKLDAAEPPPEAVVAVRAERKPLDLSFDGKRAAARRALKANPDPTMTMGDDLPEDEVIDGQ